MGWIWVWVVVVVLMAVLIGGGMLVDHRRYRGIPDRPGLTGSKKRRARRRDRDALTRHETPVRHTGYEGVYGSGGGGGDGGG